MLKLVPFNSAWISNTKIDVHAIYRRPRYVTDAYGEQVREVDADGIPTWDLTGALPVKQDIVWRGKGYEYVTLADMESLMVAAQHNTIVGDWREYRQHRVGGPWNYRLYAEGQAHTHTAEADQLKADVDEFGWQAVERIRRQQDPTFTLPAHLKQPKVDVKPEPKTEPEAKADVAKPKAKSQEVSA